MIRWISNTKRKLKYDVKVRQNYKKNWVWRSYFCDNIHSITNKLIKFIIYVEDKKVL